MRALYGCALLALALFTAPVASAQEVQVPIDSEGRIEVVDAELARRAGLWVVEYPGFVEARLFRTPDGMLVLEISEEREGRLVRHRQPLTAAEADVVRQRVSDALAAGPRPELRRELDQHGRNLLIAQTTLAGLTFYGWALPYSVGANEASAGGLYLVTAAASFFLPFWLTVDQPVTLGMANLSRYGVSRGILHGILIGEVLDGGSGGCDSGIDVDCDPFEDERLRAGLGMAASVAEGLGGYLWAQNADMTAGTAHTVALGGDVGIASGLLSGVILDLDGGDGFRAGSALGLAGAGLGVYGGRVLASRRAYTWGDAQVMYTGAMLGAWTGGAAAAVPQSSEEVGAAAALLGGWTGLYITDRLVSRTDFSGGEANLVMLSTFAGGLAGAGVGTIMENEDVAIIGGAAGAIAGFALAYGSFTRRDPAPPLASSGPLDIRVHPEGLAGLLTGGTDTSRPRGLLSITYRF